MAKTTLNAKNLEALGAERLTELLIELSRGNAAAKRRLRMELAGERGTDALAKEVRNRINTIERSRSFVDWQGIRTLANDLDAQRRAIIEKVAKVDPKEALDLLWRLMALASSVFERCDDSNGTVVAVFHETCRHIGDVAQRANVNPTLLADQAFDALTRNDYGQFDELIPSRLNASTPRSRRARSRRGKGGLPKFGCCPLAPKPLPTRSRQGPGVTQRASRARGSCRNTAPLCSRARSLKGLEYNGSGSTSVVRV